MQKTTSLSNSPPDLKEILRLKAENEALKVKVRHLESLVDTSSLIIPVKQMTDEELLCVEQIRMLKKQSVLRELTLEEAKKADIYVKMLTAIRGKSKNPDDAGKDLSVEELLSNLSENE